MTDQNRDMMYSDGPDSPPTTDAGEKTESNDEGEQTGLLPKSFFGSKELTPGKQCKVEIVKTYDDEVQVKYIAHNGDSKESESPSEDATPADKSEDMYSDA
jgi:hypothetical protein